MMKNAILLSLWLGLASALPALAETSENLDAKSFIQEKCSGCHDSSVYTRKDHKVKSLPKLDAQVRMCDAQLGIQLFDEDVTSIVNYLNENYYHFDK